MPLKINWTYALKIYLTAKYFDLCTKLNIGEMSSLALPGVQWLRLPLLKTDRLVVESKLAAGSIFSASWVDAYIMNRAPKLRWRNLNCIERKSITLSDRQGHNNIPSFCHLVFQFLPFLPSLKANKQWREEWEGKPFSCSLLNLRWKGNRNEDYYQIA